MVILDLDIVKERVVFPKGGGKPKISSKGRSLSLKPHPKTEREKIKEALEKQETKETFSSQRASSESIEVEEKGEEISSNEGEEGSMEGEGAGGEGEGAGGGDVVGEAKGIEGGIGEYKGIFEADKLDRPLKIISFSPPKYPKDAKENGISGIVKVRLLINREGLVESIEVIEENPKGFGFKEEVLKVVKDYRFEKPTILGRPVSVYCILPLRFSLED